MEVKVKKIINVKGLLAKIVLSTKEFDVTSNLCVGKDGSYYLKLPSREYEIRGEKKYENLVWMKERYEDVLSICVEKYQEEEGKKSNYSPDIPF